MYKRVLFINPNKNSNPKLHINIHLQLLDQQKFDQNSVKIKSQNLYSSCYTVTIIRTK